VAGEEPRRLKRGVLVGAVAVLVVVVVAIVVVVVQVRRVDRTAEALCERLTEAQDLDQSFTTLDPATLEPQLAALQRAKEVAPADIQAQITTLADFVDEVAAQVGEAANDRDDALSSALGARQDQIDAVTAAGQAVQAWAQINCGLSLTAPTSTNPAPADTAPTN
jgi:biopolymer transport protein ExbB/TolQ